MSSFTSMKVHMWRQDIMSASATQKETLGALRVLADGRKFRYAKNGGVALQAGDVLMSLAAVANHINQAPAADVAIGATEVTVTVGATAVTANQYAGGFLQVNSGADALGHQYSITGNTACDASGDTVVTLGEPIKVALAAATHKVSLIYNPWTGLVVATGAAISPAGVAVCNVPISNYCWVQTGGVACVQMDTTTAVGNMLFPDANGEAGDGPNATNGAVLAAGPVIGLAYATAGVADECKPAILTLD